MLTTAQKIKKLTPLLDTKDLSKQENYELHVIVGRSRSGGVTSYNATQLEFIETQLSKHFGAKNVA